MQRSDYDFDVVSGPSYPPPEPPRPAPAGQAPAPQGDAVARSAPPAVPAPQPG